MYKYDLGLTLGCCWDVVALLWSSCIVRVYSERERVWDRERGRCLYRNRRVWRRRGARGRCLCASYCCNLTLIVIFLQFVDCRGFSLIWVSTLTSVSFLYLLIFCFLVQNRITQFWPSEVNRIEFYQKIYISLTREEPTLDVYVENPN